MTPFEIGIVMHYVTRANDHPGVAEPPPIWRSTIKMLIESELLVVSGTERAYEPTERAKVYVDGLCGMPLPVHQWVMPAPPLGTLVATGTKP